MSWTTKILEELTSAIADENWELPPTQWEMEFVDSICRQRRQPGWQPSDKQLLALNKIHAKICEGDRG